MRRSRPVDRARTRGGSPRAWRAVLVAGLLLPSVLRADEVDDLLAKRRANVARLKRLHADVSVETSGERANGRPGRRVTLAYGFTIRARDRHDRDPLKRFDTEVEVTAPASFHMHFKVENGRYSYLASSGNWVAQELPEQAKALVKGIAEAQGEDVGSERRNFHVRRLPDHDSFFGGRKGLEFVSGAKPHLTARRVEEVDAGTGQPVVTEEYDDRGRLVSRTRVSRFGTHHGVVIPEDSTSEAYLPAGKIVRRTTMANVDVETE